MTLASSIILEKAQIYTFEGVVRVWFGSWGVVRMWFDQYTTWSWLQHKKALLLQPTCDTSETVFFVLSKILF